MDFFHNCLSISTYCYKILKSKKNAIKQIKIDLFKRLKFKKKSSDLNQCNSPLA